MRDPIFITDVGFLDAMPDDLRKGLVGYVCCRLGGKIFLDGLTLRRSREGRLYIAFPKYWDALGREHVNVRPLNAAAQHEVEAQIFLALGIEQEAGP